MDNLIIQKYPDNIHSLYLPRTIKITKSLTSPVEVQQCNLLLGQGYQVKDNLKIALIGPDLCFFEAGKKGTIRVDYRLKPHPKLANFYVVSEVKEEYLSALINFCHTVCLREGEVKDW